MIVGAGRRWRVQGRRLRWCTVDSFFLISGSCGSERVPVAIGPANFDPKRRVREVVEVSGEAVGGVDAHGGSGLQATKADSMNSAVGPTEGAYGYLLAVDPNVAEFRRGVDVLGVSLAGGVQRFVHDQAKLGVLEVPCGLDEDALAVLAGGARDDLEVRRQGRP